MIDSFVDDYDYDGLIVFIKNSEITESEHIALFSLIQNLPKNESDENIKYRYLYKTDGLKIITSCTAEF